MTKWKEFSDSTILQAEDLPAEGTTVTIAKVDQGLLESEDKDKKTVTSKKPLVTFRETPTQWAVNPHNRHCVEAMFGDDIEAAIGKRVTLAQKPCEYKGLYYGKPSIRVTGSPDIDKPIKLLIGKSARRRGIEVTLTPTRGTTTAATPQDATATATDSETGSDGGDDALFAD